MRRDYLTPVSGSSGPAAPGRDNAQVNWLFRNRRTGEITVAQRPNAALGIFLAAALVNAVLDPSGAFGTTLTVVARAALAFWAADELLRGVNPFRRILGAVVLTSVVAGLMS